MEVSNPEIRCNNMVDGKSRGMKDFPSCKLEISFMKTKFFKFPQVSGKLAKGFDVRARWRRRRYSENSGGYYCGYTSWVYHQRWLYPASPGGPHVVMVAYGPSGGPIVVDQDGGSPA
jgi:hypothetical protein